MYFITESLKNILFIYINSILAVIYLTKLQNLINRPVMNCSMSIFPYFYKVRSASNMIPCFPANNSTDVHHCDIVSSRSSPSHFTKDTPFNTSQVRTRSTKKNLTTAWKIK